MMDDEEIKSKIIELQKDITGAKLRAKGAIAMDCFQIAQDTIEYIIAIRLEITSLGKNLQ
jgi:hypothetical protein